MELRNIRGQRWVKQKLAKLSANVCPFPDNVSNLLRLVYSGRAHKKSDHPGWDGRLL
jgi:hypothetical protein